MKIIKVNDSQEKLKYEIYSMQLKQEQAKKYREKLAKEIQFFRLRLPKTDYLNLGSEIFGNSSLDKIIYGLPSFSIDEYEVGLYDSNRFKLEKHFRDVQEKYLLYRYLETPSNRLTNYDEAREAFLNRFVKQGLLGYNIHLNQYGVNNAFYIFTWPLSDFCDSSMHTDNVIRLPIASIAWHLIETGNFEVANSLGIFNENNLDIEAIMNNFDFEHNLSITNDEMQELIEAGLVQEEVLTRKISQDYNVSSYIK